MAMKEPIARTRRRPRDRSGCAGIEMLRDRVGNLVGWIDLIPVLVADTVYLKVETMQVHGMIAQARVKDVPMRGIAGPVRKALCVRPGLAIDGQDFPKWWSEYA